MKISIKVLLSASLLANAFFILLALVSNFNHGNIDTIQEMNDLLLSDVPETVQVLEHLEETSIFGDQEKYFVIELKENELENFINKTSWNHFESLDLMGVKSIYEYKYGMLERELDIPEEITNGYFFFYDYVPNSHDQYSKPVWAREVKDFVLAILDANQGRLYVLRLKE